MAQAPKPKKKDQAPKEERPFLGKLEKNHCRIGIVGLPNIGKSSFFNILSEKQVPAENYPFCTIDPSQTQVAVPDKRFDHLVEAYKPAKNFRAVLDVWDIAGLVKGAHEGKGLGNEFLSNIASVDAIFHLVRAFKDKKIDHVEGDVNPIRDMEIIRAELIAKDLAMMSTKFENMDKAAKRSNDKKVKDELVVVERIFQGLKENKEIQFIQWSPREIEYLRSYNLFTAKPVVFLVNVGLKDWLKGSNKWIAEIQEWVKGNYPGSPVIPFSATFEKMVIDMKEEERNKYLEENKTKSAINRIITNGYDALSLIHYFTAGEDEVKCWTIRAGTKAPQAAGVIHTDFETGFICAEVMSYKDWKKCGGEQGCKATGKYRQHGKDYVVQDGDIMFFKFNRPVPKKK